MPLSACQHWRADQAANAAQGHDPTPRRGARSDRLAREIVVSLGWDRRRKDNRLPYDNGNPYSAATMRVVPRPLLNRILALTEFDAELHLRAGNLEFQRQSTLARLIH